MFPFIKSIADLDYETVIEDWKNGEKYYNREEKRCDDNRKAECELYLQVSSS